MADKAGRAVVIGGGLAGLAAGYGLSRDGWDVLVLEKESEVGGRCRTFFDNGFQFDSGAQHFRDSYDATLKTAIEVGLGETLRMPTGGKGIMHNGKVAHFNPRSPNPFSLLPWSSLGPRGLMDLAAVMRRLLRHYRSYDVRFPDRWEHGDLMTAGGFLGQITTPGFRGSFAEPVAVYWGGAGLEKLSASGFMVALRSTFADRPGALTGGMGTLPAALARRLDVKTGIEVNGVAVEGDAAVAVKAKPVTAGRARSYNADLVVCAVPAPLVSGIVGKLGLAVEGCVEKAEYSPAIVVNLGFSGEVRGDVGPVLLPSAEGFGASWACTQGSKAIEYAPEMGSVVTLVYAGRQCVDVMGGENDEILERALSDAGRVFKLGGLFPVSRRVDRHLLGRPVVSPGHARRVEELRVAGSGIENLYFAGDWMRSPTLEGAMRSGFEVARKARLRA